MRIEIKKTTAYQCEYTLIRADQPVEQISLETKTYFTHDICHYVVEKKMHYQKGFWGMLSAGYSFASLFGKDNAQTAELRFIEQLVGPIQSVFWGHIDPANFNDMIQHLDVQIPEAFLTACVDEITEITQQWNHLPVGQCLILEW